MSEHVPVSLSHPITRSAATHALVVEDDPVCAQLVSELLERTSEFVVERAESLGEGIEKSGRREPDIVLLDLMLPDSDGLETFRRMQSAASGVPIIVFTGHDDETLAITTMKEGAQDYLMKGAIDRPALLRAIRYSLERARIRRSLDRERKLSTMLFEGIPDRVYLKDQQSRFLRINRLLADVLGLTDSDEAVGKTDFDFFQTAHAQQTFAEEQKVIETGVPLVGKVEHEVSLSGKSAWLSSTKMAVRDADGRIVGTFGVSRDITELKRAEEALRKSEGRYRGLLESVMDYNYTVQFSDGRPVATLHSDGCLAVTGYTQEEYAADPSLWSRMIHPEDVSTVLAKVDGLLLGEPARAVEHRIIHKNGSVRWIRNTPALHYDDEGHLKSYDGVVADITERKEAEMQLQAANARLRELVAELTRSHQELQGIQLELIESAKMQLVGQLAAGVAHEVKNPLAVLLLGLDCLQNDLPDKDGPLAAILEEMEAAVRRASKVIGGLLDFSSSSNLELAAYDLNDVIERSLEYVRHLMRQGKITVIRHLGQQLPSALLDVCKMEQVLVNIFTNACHAMPHGGEVTVETAARTLGPLDILREPGDHSWLRLGPGDKVLIIKIHDTGPGIPEDKISRIFEPFFTTKPTGQGTGLGLTVSRNIIELHGGTIEIYNAEEGGVTVALTVRAGEVTI